MGGYPIVTYVLARDSTHQRMDIPPMEVLEYTTSKYPNTRIGGYSCGIGSTGRVRT